MTRLRRGVHECAMVSLAPKERLALKKASLEWAKLSPKIKIKEGRCLSQGETDRTVANWFDPIPFFVRHG